MGGKLEDVARKLDWDIRQLESFYEFRNSPEVANYLRNYPFLIPLLFEGFAVVERFFGPNPRVVLEVVHDPEIAGKSELFAYISTALSPGEALDRLNRLDEEWFLEQTDRTQGKFNFNIEFA